MGSNSSGVEAGFAKLQGEDFEYYMQTYSIILGRYSKKSTVDVDLSSLGGGTNISRHHACIFYDFQRHRFALEVIGKNGCFIEGVLHLPGNLPVKLDSQDLLQIGDKEFYFLLPVRSILGGPIEPRHHLNYPVAACGQHHLALAPMGRDPSGVSPLGVGYDGVRKKGAKGRVDEHYEEYEDDDNGVIGGAKKMRRTKGLIEYDTMSGELVPADEKVEERSRVDREADNHQLLRLEENDVVSSVATVLSDLCGPGEWMAMEKLHSELVEQYSNIWHHSRVRRYLTCEDYSGPEAKRKPWYGLFMLLKKYPEHFVINTRSKGRVTHEFVSLVSLLS